RWRVPRVPDWACHLTAPPPPPPRLFPYTTLFRSWVPGNDKRYTGINPYLDVTFANNSQRTPAKIVRISSTHDVAMIKIDLPEALPKVELFDSYNEIQPGDATIVMGYPGIAPAQLVLKIGRAHV